MSNKINSTTTGAGGLESTAHGDDGILLIQSDGVTVATFNTTGISGDGSQLTNLPAGGGLTHLGTLTTTSGTTQSLAAQNFSLYDQIWIISDNVSSGGSADYQVGLNGDAVINTSGAVPAASGTWAWFRIDLRTNVFFQTWLQSTATTSGSGTFDNLPTTGGYYNLGTNYRAVTSGAITIAMEGQTFDAGSAEIYGVN